MAGLEYQTADTLFENIRTGERVMYPAEDEEKEYEEIFRQMEDEDIQERSRRAEAYAEAAKIYLTF